MYYIYNKLHVFITYIHIYMYYIYIYIHNTYTYICIYVKKWKMFHKVV